jgi:hypothetical protein
MIKIMKKTTEYVQILLDYYGICADNQEDRSIQNDLKPPENMKGSNKSWQSNIRTTATPIQKLKVSL